MDPPLASDAIGWARGVSAWTKAATSSATVGKDAAAAIQAARSGNGQIEFKFDMAAASLLVEGASVTLLLYLDATHYYTVPAIITQFKVDVNIDTGEVIGGSANFDTDGAWTEPTLP